MNNENKIFERSKIKDIVENFRAWFLKTFFIPVKAQKCPHEYKLRNYHTYRTGKTKIVTMKHYCTLCGLQKNTTHKY